MLPTDAETREIREQVCGRLAVETRFARKARLVGDSFRLRSTLEAHACFGDPAMTEADVQLSLAT